jgi:GT2 family glycosyltransferase/2-polyprenyl-3-methyl-5-hydroxy-6-metoxy-1,4-benzoquinol methylase
MSGEAIRGAAEGDALRYEAHVDLSETNTARTQLVLLTGKRKKVLEVGPATGYITKALGERGCSVTGLEIDAKAAEVAGEFAERMIVGDIEAMDLKEFFGEERFDVVMYGDVLEHLVDPEKALVDTRGILGPGGRVVASIPNVAHASVRLALLAGRFPYSSEGLLDRTHLRFFTRESIQALFEAAGYEVSEVRVSTTGPFGTELGLRSEDFPPSLVEAVMELPDSDTYQFIVDAHPMTAAPVPSVDREGGGETVTRERVAPLWNAEEELSRRAGVISALTSEVEWLRDVAKRAEEGREGTEAELSRLRSSTAYRLARGVVRPLRRLFPKRKRPETPQARGTSEEYRTWQEKFEPGSAELDDQRAGSARLTSRPLISVVIASAGSPAKDVERSVGSVGDQTYDRWELCVARSVEEALAEAAGDFVAFLDPGDLLAPFALYKVARALDGDPAPDVLYSDRDRISEAGDRTDPFFTPEWSPELLLSAGYMSHLLVVRRDVYEQAGGVDPEMGDERLWDLALRLGERTRGIARIPAILYHRRAEAPDPARQPGRAVQAHLDRLGRKASVVRSEEGLRIAWRLRDTPQVSLIIPTRHNRPMLERCLSSIARADYTNREVLVIETAPREPDKEAWYSELTRRFPLEVLWWDGPFNYSAVNNRAAKQAAGDILLFLNDDTEAVGEEWLTELVGWAAQPEIGAVGAQLLNDDGTIQHGGIVVGLTGFAGQLFKFLRPGDWSLMGSTMWYRNVLAVTGACLAMRRDVFEEIGGWDERYVLAGSDVELGLRLLRKGYRVVCTPFAQLRHTEQATRGSEIPEEDFHTSFEDYREYLYEGDPYFNPNLDYDSTAPRLTTGEYSSLETVSRILGRDLSARA